ncbi:hypothetical protein HYALB_00003205 [Hymenoscyphus albidus]|uniref:Uncharacterized protein n=1 Tax=Hymenoscyphus albidus TaxID=595503 RepID=A0A9N9LYC7_9HELO|nr:hypothetical protein HYALB_00003205 [Hymenoscyphus albidus]
MAGPQDASKIYGFVSPESIPKARPLYRFAATGLSASMWFWVMYKAKKDGAESSDRRRVERV